MTRSIALEPETENTQFRIFSFAGSSNPAVQYFTIEKLNFPSSSEDFVEG